MDLIADVLLSAGAFTAALYCWVLSKRIKGLSNLDSGLGSAIASLSAQVNDMQSALKATQSMTGASIAEMKDLSERAEKAAEKLNLMLATVQEDKNDREEPARRTSRVRKFPAAPKKETLAKRSVSRLQEIEESETDADVDTSRAEKLHKDVVEKITARSEETGSREELVQMLQSILSASK